MDGRTVAEGIIRQLTTCYPKPWQVDVDPVQNCEVVSEYGDLIVGDLTDHEAQAIIGLSNGTANPGVDWEALAECLLVQLLEIHGNPWRLNPGWDRWEIIAKDDTKILEIPGKAKAREIVDFAFAVESDQLIGSLEAELRLASNDHGSDEPGPGE